MKWTEVHPCVGGGAQWEAYPTDTHAVDIWRHEKEGFSWCVITDDVDANAPEGWSPTVEDAKRHAEQAYNEWVEEHDETAEIVADAVAQERAAVVAFLRDSAEAYSRDTNIYHTATALWDEARCIELGEHRREEEE
jgi:hypothetical protein